MADNKWTPPKRLFGDEPSEDVNKFDAPPPPPTVRSLGQLSPAPYGTLVDKATMQQWRGAFGLLQMRCKDLEKHVKYLEDYIKEVIPDYVNGRLTAYENVTFANDTGLQQMIIDVMARVQTIERYILPSDDGGNEGDEVDRQN